MLLGTLALLVGLNGFAFPRAMERLLNGFFLLCSPTRLQRGSDPRLGVEERLLVLLPKEGNTPLGADDLTWAMKLLSVLDEADHVPLRAPEMLEVVSD
jgi:hypothetical protein